MPKIKNWKKINYGRYPVWQNKTSGRIITLMCEPDWEPPCLAEIYENYSVFHGVIMGENSIDVIGCYDTKSSMIRNVISWMREHPDGKTERYLY